MYKYYININNIMYKLIQYIVFLLYIFVIKIILIMFFKFAIEE